MTKTSQSHLKNKDYGQRIIKVIKEISESLQSNLKKVEISSQKLTSYIRMSPTSKVILRLVLD